MPYFLSLFWEHADFREASNQFFRDGVDFPQGLGFLRVNLPVVLHCGGLTALPESFREKLHVLDFGLNKDVHMCFLMGRRYFSMSFFIS